MAGEISVPWGLTEGIETSAVLGEGTEIHGALVIPLPGCCEWSFRAVRFCLWRARADGTGRRKTVGWKEILAMERRGGYNEKKGAWLTCFAQIAVRIAGMQSFALGAARSCSRR